MKAGILGNLSRFGLDFLIGLAIFSVIAMLVLDGEAPRQLPPVTHVLSINANAADYSQPAGHALTVGTPSDPTAFRFTHAWTALAVIAVMFAMLYAFNLALYRRLCRDTLLARRRGLVPR
jgi:hypothetical protein